MPYFGVTPAAEFTSKDLNGEQLILDADADTTITADTDDQIDIRIAGADDFQFTANKFLVQTGSNLDMNGTELILDADADTSITADTDDQIDIRIAGADDFQFTANTFTALSGSTVAIASGATIANSGTATGFGFVSGGVRAVDGSAGAPGLAFADDTDHGFFRTSDKLGYSVGGSERIRFDGKLILVGDTANSKNAIGITLNQDTLDDEIFALKSSDVAHPATGEAEADTYYRIKKRSATLGGVQIAAFNEGNTLGYEVLCYSSSDPTTTAATNSPAMIQHDAAKHDGSYQNFGANTMIHGWGKYNNSGARNTLMLLDEDGDIFVDGSTSITAFDKEDDALLARAFDVVTAPSAIIKSEFDKFLVDAKEKLQDAGILGRVDPENAYDECGMPARPMVNMNQLQRLHNGAIWQQRVMFETLKEVADELLPGFADKLNERLESRKLPALPV